MHREMTEVWKVITEHETWLLEITRDFFSLGRDQDYVFTSLPDCTSRNQDSFCKAQQDDFHSLKITFCLINVTSLKHLYNFVYFRKMPATRPCEMSWIAGIPPSDCNTCSWDHCSTSNQSRIMCFTKVSLTRSWLITSILTPLPAAAH